MKKLLTAAVAALVAWGAAAQTTAGLDPLLQNVYARNTQSLNGYWRYVVDRIEVGYYDYRHQPVENGFFVEPQVDNVRTWKEYDFDTSPVMPVPGDWNTFDERLSLYDGAMWFRRKFVYHPQQGERTFLYFGAVNYDAKVFVNGRFAGEHEGGFTPFNFDVTELMRPGENTVMVMADSQLSPRTVPVDNYDWYNYGGILRDVMLVTVPQDFIRTYKFELQRGTRDRIRVEVKLDKALAGQEVTVGIPELKVNRSAVTDADGVAAFEVKASPELWSPENPRLYEVTVAAGADRVSDRIGFRTVETRGRDILLNGKEIFLKGICIHDEAAFRDGRIYSAEECRTLLGWAKELGCNFVRLAHYPHNELMVREAERMGLLVWDEIPVYWTIDFSSGESLANARNQLDEMMERDMNRANVIIWSVANETPHSSERDAFLSSLARYAKSKDGSRLISMAMEKSPKSPTVFSVKDNMNEYVDIISVNQYTGWYGEHIDVIDRVSWEIDYDKPIVMSEVGAEALAGYHSEEMKIWSEEYQAEFYRKTLKMIDERMPKLAGITPWILKDFRSTRRVMPVYQEGYNRKGLVSERGERKEAFRVLQQWYKDK